MSTITKKHVELSRKMRAQIATTAAEALEALDNGRIEYARSLLTVLVAADPGYKGKYSPEVAIRRAAAKVDK